MAGVVECSVQHEGQKNRNSGTKGETSDWKF